MNKAERNQRVIYSAFNTSIIMMATMMEDFTEFLTDTAGAMASGMAEACGDEEAGEEIRKEVRESKGGLDQRLRELISEQREPTYKEMERKRHRIEPLITDPIWDEGPKIVDRYDFGLPKMTEVLNDDTMVAYAKMLVEEDPAFTEMFKALVDWINRVPQEDLSGDD